MLNKKIILQDRIHHVKYINHHFSRTFAGSATITSDMFVSPPMTYGPIKIAAYTHKESVRYCEIH